MVLKLNLPENILGKEQYVALSTYQKGEYVTNLLKQIIELNPQGVTISQIDKGVKLGHSTIWHHLEKLADSAFCLKMERGDTAVYNFNKVLRIILLPYACKASSGIFPTVKSTDNYADFGQFHININL